MDKSDNECDKSVEELKRDVRVTACTVPCDHVNLAFRSYIHKLHGLLSYWLRSSHRAWKHPLASPQPHAHVSSTVHTPVECRVHSENAPSVDLVMVITGATIFYIHKLHDRLTLLLKSYDHRSYLASWCVLTRPCGSWTLQPPPSSHATSRSGCAGVYEGRGNDIVRLYCLVGHLISIIPCYSIISVDVAHHATDAAEPSAAAPTRRSLPCAAGITHVAQMPAPGRCFAHNPLLP